MAMSFTGRKRIRRSFGRLAEVAQMPNLIEVQKTSYDAFLQTGIPMDQREKAGLQEVFSSVFPIKDFSDRSRLEFVRYELERPKYDVEECRQRGLTYTAQLKVSLRLVVWDVDEETGSRSLRDIKEQEVYMGDIPLMTEHGTFIVNGTERVIVSQMHRSPGVFFDHDKGKTHSSGKYLFAARVIPIAAPGSISNSMPRTWSMSVSTAAGSCRRRHCCWRSTMPRPLPSAKSWPSKANSWIRVWPRACPRKTSSAPSMRKSPTR